MDLATYMSWSGRRVWLKHSNSTKTRRLGQVVHVTPPGLFPGDVDLSVRLDGAITPVRASEKGKLWDLAD
jgi:hypothetical protein